MSLNSRVEVARREALDLLVEQLAAEQLSTSEFDRRVAGVRAAATEAGIQDAVEGVATLGDTTSDVGAP